MTVCKENIMTGPSPGTLYLVATPIGNLSDISMRAINTLGEVDFIAAEDTRVTRKLLEHYNIKKQLISYHKHNSRTGGEKALARILAGENCALVTDAGIPAVSDPGEDLVRLCVNENIPAVIIPGPCAAVSALALSGLPSDRFTFEGFLPVDKKSRSNLLDKLSTEERTMIFYEAPHKLLRTLNDLLNKLGDRHVSISREMTKIYEETLRFTLSEAVEYFEQTPPRGEFVLVVEGVSALDTDKGDKLNEAADIAARLIENGSTASEAVKKAADETGCSKNALYKLIVDASN